MAGAPTRRRLLLPLLLTLLVAPLVTLAPVALGSSQPDVEHRTVHVEARQFAFTPGVIRVPVGASVRLELASHDVTHGLYLEGHAVSLVAKPGRPASADFVAGAPGRYRFYCSLTCGQMHPFMLGELIVEPNWQLSLALGLLPFATVAGLAISWGQSAGTGRRLDLTSWRASRSLLASRAVHQGVVALALAAMTLLVLAGFFGSPIGSHNAAIVLVWIAWWGLLKLVLIPLGGRAWCAVCPLPAGGEWLQRRAVLTRRLGPALSVELSWPRKLRGGWLAVGLLLAIGVASGPVLTDPRLTAWLLAGMAALAIALSLVYRGRAFCRYLCPVGSFVGLYSLAAPLAVRVKEPEVCASHREKECLRGSESAYGCPWFAYPGTLTRSVDCGLCLECLRACPKDNVAVYLQRPGHDLVSTSDRRWPRIDEAFAAIVMLALAAIYSAVFLGPWGELKRDALLATPLDAARHALLVVGGAGLVAPALWLGLAWIARRVSRRADVGLKETWSATAYALVPLGLAAWIAFTVGFVLNSGTYVLSALADPLGWGWSLGGLAVSWAPLATALRPWLQLAAWLGGLAWSASIGMQAARGLFGEGSAGPRAGVSVAVGLALATGGIAWLGLG